MKLVNRRLVGVAVAVLALLGTTGVAAPSAAAAANVVSYRAHVQSIGWQSWVGSGATAGTEGRGLRVEALQFRIDNATASGSIGVKAHVQSLGWTNMTYSGTAGTTGQGLRLEAVCLHLSGALGNSNQLYFRTHVQNLGWTNWATSTHCSGSTGLGYRIEAIQVVVQPYSAPAPSGWAEQALYSPGNLDGEMYGCKTSVQTLGWMYEHEGCALVGTVGRGLPMEAFSIRRWGSGWYNEEIEVSAHVQGVGWQDYVGEDIAAGTVGRGLSIEALRLRISSEWTDDRYDIYYRVHAANVGWLGWAKNDEPAGTVGYGNAVQAVEVMIVRKGFVPPADGGLAAFRQR